MEAMTETPRACEAIIRSFPGRVLTVTVLGAHKRPLSFDSCAPASNKRARIDERFEVRERRGVRREEKEGSGELGEREREGRGGVARLGRVCTDDVKIKGHAFLDALLTTLAPLRCRAWPRQVTTKRWWSAHASYLGRRRRQCSLYTRSRLPSGSSVRLRASAPAACITITPIYGRRPRHLSSARLQARATAAARLTSTICPISST